GGCGQNGCRKSIGTGGGYGRFSIQAGDCVAILVETGALRVDSNVAVDDQTRVIAAHRQSGRRRRVEHKGAFARADGFIAGHGPGGNLLRSIDAENLDEERVDVLRYHDLDVVAGVLERTARVT